MSWTISGRYFCDICGELLPGSRSPCLCNNCLTKGEARLQNSRTTKLEKRIEELESKLNEKRGR